MSSATCKLDLRVGRGWDHLAVILVAAFDTYPWALFKYEDAGPGRVENSYSLRGVWSLRERLVYVWRLRCGCPLRRGAMYAAATQTLEEEPRYHSMIMAEMRGAGDLRIARYRNGRGDPSGLEITDSRTAEVLFKDYGEWERRYG
jgi:hypothetical protein